MSWIEGKTAVVTGANAGIGLETARGLAKAGATVVMCARSQAKGEAAVADVKKSTGRSDVELLLLDLASLASVRRAADELLSGGRPVHCLVNNAGLVLGTRQETEDGFESTFGVNHLGPFLFTHRLLDRIRESGPGRIVNLSSAAHRRTKGLDFDDLMRTARPYSAIAAYADSKLANVLFTRELARRLEGSDVVTHAVHPGVVRTRFGKDGDTGFLFGALISFAGMFFLSPEQGAATSLHVALSDDAASTTGEYWAKSKRERPTRAGRDDVAAGRLWTVSEQLVGLG